MQHGTTSGYTKHRCRCPECKAAMSAYMAAYYVRNKERVAAYQAANRDKILADKVALRRREKERLLRERNDRAAANRLRWASEDPYGNPSPKHCGSCDRDLPRSAFSRFSRTYDGLDHRCRECAADRAAARRAAKRGQWVEHVDRNVVWVRDGGVCYLCDEPADVGDWHLDHIEPIALGGEHSYQNTAVTHPACNQAKCAKRTDRVPVALRSAVGF